MDITAIALALPLNKRFNIDQFMKLTDYNKPTAARVRIRSMIKSGYLSVHGVKCNHTYSMNTTQRKKVLSKKPTQGVRSLPPCDKGRVFDIVKAKEMACKIHAEMILKSVNLL